MTGISDKERQTLLSMVEDVAGPDVREVAIILLTHKGELTDEVISDELGIKLNQVRKALYLLADLDLASFRRERDKTTGWFVFFWKVHPEKIRDLVKEKQENVLDKISVRLKYEQGNMFFTCETEGCKRVTFQNAMELDFICMVCESRLESFDNSKIISVLEKKVDQLNEILH
ncbi:transcription factor [archaeon]|jgi:transcription initiation factor TFIIE subunit alpha|nr:transcription factor [Candidatus Heimdallarchaeota archaeon]MEC8704625.1 transcription factor [Asgard group archaeon]NDB78654.1 transcription factor [archaeon]|tara:strand:+ start:98 stop:616 length:519 start_codon:yes stop_codon:yes gene_type:complete